MSLTPGTLRNVIMKAVNNRLTIQDELISKVHIRKSRLGEPVILLMSVDGSEFVFRIYQLIFIHEFAQAFFGKRIVCYGKGCNAIVDDYDAWFKHTKESDYDCYSNIEEWKHHLKGMVLRENAFEYLVEQL